MKIHTANRLTFGTVVLKPQKSDHTPIDPQKDNHFTFVMGPEDAERYQRLHPIPQEDGTAEVHVNVVQAEAISDPAKPRAYIPFVYYPDHHCKKPEAQEAEDLRALIANAEGIPSGFAERFNKALEAAGKFEPWG